MDHITSCLVWATPFKLMLLGPPSRLMEVFGPSMAKSRAELALGYG